MKVNSFFVGVSSFMIILIITGLSHALMVLNEKILEDYKLHGAIIIGFIGVLSLVIGIKKNDNDAIATILGLFGGMLIWTGWIEFSFIWIADKLHVSGLVENGEVVTKPEYLIMPSSIGLLATFLLLYLFTFNRCQFFNWFQRLFGLKKHLKVKDIEKPITVTVFVETIMILWLFYIVLLLVYDKDIAGDKHPMTYIVAFGSLFWSIYLFLNLIRISKFGYSIRYAVPTVIIFWNFVEVLGRWDLFKEIWVHPFEHWKEMVVLFIVLVSFITYYLIENKKTIKN